MEDRKQEGSTYRVQIRCSNCNAVKTVDIKKGQLITDYVVGEVCTTCGCKTMRYFKTGTNS